MNIALQDMMRLFPAPETIQGHMLVSCSICDIEEVYLGDMKEEGWFPFWRTIVDGEWVEYGPICPRCCSRHLSPHGPVLRRPVSPECLVRSHKVIREATVQEMDEWINV